MAAPRSARQKQEVAQFIGALFEQSPFETWAEFAEQAGVHQVSLSTWKTGKSVPDGYNLLRLVRAAGGVPVLTGETSALAAQLEQLGERLATAIERFEALEAEAPPPTPRQAASTW